MASLRESLPTRDFTVDEVEKLGFDRNEIVALLRVLAADNRGKFTIGRRGHPSRFEWASAPQPVPVLAPAVQPVVAAPVVPLPPSSPTSENQAVRKVPMTWLQDPSFWDADQRAAIAAELLDYRMRDTT